MKRNGIRTMLGGNVMTAGCLLALMLTAGVGAQGEPWRLEGAGDTPMLVENTVTEPYIALHFLIPGDANAVRKIIGEYNQMGLTRAGVRHLYVFRGSAGEVGDFVKELKLEKIDLYRDAGGDLARAAKLEEGQQALVIYEQKRHTIIKTLETADGVYPMFDRFVQAFDLLTANPALGDYHLPKDSHVALKGFDPVAYFERSGAMEGKPMFKSIWRGVEYHFAEHLHRELFNANPEKYLPTYGGWCATAMADGKKVDINPENFEVEGGRLFLFYDGFWGNAKKAWDKNQAEMEPEADAEWAKISGE